MAKQAEKVQKTIRMRLDHVEKLQRLSEEEERPMAWFIDKALEAYLNEREKNQ